MARPSRSRTQFERSLKDRKPTVRERERIRRDTTLASPEFHKWYEARVEIQPTPSDPYRAYMIDRSLRAKRYEEKDWRDYVNRSDLPPVDNFTRGDDPQDQPDHTPPSPAPRHRTPTYVPASKVRPNLENEDLYKKTIADKDDFMKTYGLPDVEVIVEKRSGSAYGKAVFPGQKSKVYVPLHFYEAVKKEAHKKSVRAQYDSINFHEYGHGAQYEYGTYEEFRDDTAVPHSAELRAIMDRVKARNHKAGPNSSKLRIDAEDFAHEVADDYLIKKGRGGLKGSQKLARKFAFGTYEGTKPKSMSGPNPLFYWDDSSQLIRSTKSKKSGLLSGIL